MHMRACNIQAQRYHEVHEFIYNMDTVEIRIISDKNDIQCQIITPLVKSRSPATFVEA